MRHLVLSIVSLAVCALFACSAENAASPPDTGPDASSADSSFMPPDAAVDLGPPLAWTACPGGNGAWTDSECASITRPYVTGDAEERTVTVWIKRRPAKGTRRGQLWLLEGGPGPTAGQYLEPQMGALITELADFDVYSLDHRGTGYATLLDCPSFASQYGSAVAECLAEAQQSWDETLSGFTVGEAARDLGAAIERTRVGDEPVFIYARSYGTFWVNRYLQLYPKQASGVILDSFCTPERCLSPEFDTDSDAVAQAFFAGCAADATCKEHLGDDPWASVGSLIRGVAAGECPALAAGGLDEYTLRMFFAELLRVRVFWPMIAPLVAKMTRCEAADIQAVARFVNVYVPAHVSTSRTNLQRKPSWLLERHVPFSELPADWVVPSPSELVQRFEQTTVAPGFSLNYVLYPGWPRSPHDPATRRWAETDVPILILQGELDAATPHRYAKVAEQHFTGTHQHLVSLPRTPHAALLQSPTTPGAQSCGQQLALQFIADPKRELDTRCVQQIASIDYAAASFDPQEVFGTTSAW